MVIDANTGIEKKDESYIFDNLQNIFFDITMKLLLLFKNSLNLFVLSFQIMEGIIHLLRMQNSPKN